MPLQKVGRFENKKQSTKIDRCLTPYVWMAVWMAVWMEVRVSAAVNRSDAANGEHPPESNFAAGLLMAVSIVREMI